MAEYRLGEVEMQFATLIWEHEPIASGDLVKLCEKELNWKKSTTYTCLKRLCEKGIFPRKGKFCNSVIYLDYIVSKPIILFTCTI